MSSLTKVLAAALVVTVAVIYDIRRKIDSLEEKVTILQSGIENELQSQALQSLRAKYSGSDFALDFSDADMDAWRESRLEDYDPRVVVQVKLAWHGLFPNDKLVSNGTRKPGTFKVGGNFLKGQLDAVGPMLVMCGVEEDDSDDWEVLWSTGGHTPRNDYRKLKPHQKIDHFIGTGHLNRKDLLRDNFMAARAKFGPQVFNFHPLGYVLPTSDQEFREYYRKEGHTLMWIIKPSGLGRGRGIRMLENEDGIPDSAGLTPDKGYVLQQYIADPHLIQGYKYTMRVYITVTSWDPLQLWVFTDGFLHFSTKKYDASAEALGEIAIHVTNPDLQETEDPNYSSDNQKSVTSSYWSLEDLWAYLQKEEGLDRKELWGRIKHMTALAAVMVEFKMSDLMHKYVPKASNVFETWGMDVLFDSKMHPWLIEINHTPSMDVRFSLATKIKSQLLANLFLLIGVDQRVWEGRDRATARNNVLSCLSYDEPSSCVGQNVLGYYSEKSEGCMSHNDIEILVDFEHQYLNRAQYDLVLPNEDSANYLPYFQSHTQNNWILAAYFAIRQQNLAS